MSLINDALKKAKQAQREEPSPLSTKHFRPVDSGQRRTSLFFLLPIVVVLLSAAGGVLLWMALQKHGVIQEPTVLARQNQPVTQPAIPQKPTINQPTIARPAQPNAGAVPRTAEASPIPDSSGDQSAPPSSGPPSGTNDEVVIHSAVLTTLPAAPAPPPLPTVRGIFYNPSHPSAVLNSKTVYVGDRVAGFRVLAITPDSVTVVGAGKTNVLTLPE